MSNCLNPDINITPKPETIANFKEMYSQKKEFLEYLKRFGNQWEKAAASVVIDVAQGM